MKPLKIFLCDLTYDTTTLSTEAFPLNIGYIASYTKQLFGDDVEISLFKYIEKLENALEKVMQNRTVFIITNRLNSILEADKIFVLSKGSIVQKGTHKDLISQQGIYRDMYQIQFLDREI